MPQRGVYEAVRWLIVEGLAPLWFRPCACVHVNMCVLVRTQDNGDCVNQAVSVPQCFPEATPLRGECQLVKKNILYIYIYI